MLNINFDYSPCVSCAFFSSSSSAFYSLHNYVDANTKRFAIRNRLINTNTFVRPLDASSHLSALLCRECTSLCIHSIFINKDENRNYQRKHIKKRSTVFCVWCLNVFIDVDVGFSAVSLYIYCAFHYT